MRPPLKVVDMHAGGEPLRIVTSGYPELPPGTILQKRAYVRDNLDHLRRILMFEPRGHNDMYGAVMVEPGLDGADVAVLFMHNEGYSTMCGHAIFALGRYALDEGLVKAREPVTTVNIECPCGMVFASVEVNGGKPGAVSFQSVPAFLYKDECSLDVPGYNTVICRIGYGGAFYALADASQFGLEFARAPLRDFVDAACALTSAVNRSVTIIHPDHEDLGFLYGSILTDGLDGSAGRPSRNICVFADAQVDRSPTGSGVTARLAVMHARGEVAVGEERLFESITGSRFSGTVIGPASAGALPAVRVRVSGRAHYCGRTEFIVEDDDPLGGGFLVR